MESQSANDWHQPRSHANDALDALGAIDPQEIQFADQVGGQSDTLRQCSATADS
jgi:hypothetical protein